MQKAKEHIYIGPRALPIVYYENEQVFVDLRLGEFRPVERPFESISFNSVFGQELCARSGIITCRSCKMSVMISKAFEQKQLCCMNCFNLL